MNIEECIKDLQLKRGIKYELAAKYLYNNFLYLLNRSDSILSRDEIFSVYLETIRIVIEHIMNPQKDIMKVDRYFYKVFINIRNTETKKRVRRNMLLDEYRFYVCNQKNDEKPELEELNDIINSLKQLTVKEKTVIILYFFNRNTHEQIASKLDISVSNSKTILCRSKAKLRNCFKTREQFVKVLV